MPCAVKGGEALLAATSAATDIIDAVAVTGSDACSYCVR